MPSVTVNGATRAGNYEAIADTTSAVGLTSTKYKTQVTTNTNAGGPNTSFMRDAVEALITVETGAIRWTLDGTTPTTTASTAVGHLADAGDVITIQGYAAIAAFRCINAVASSGAVLRVTYFFN